MSPSSLRPPNPSFNFPLPSFPRFAKTVSNAVTTTAGQTTFSQINLQHCKAASALLSRDLAVRQTHVSLIQEPWINKGQVLGIELKGGSLVHGDSERGPRACVLINKKHTVLKLHQFCTRDLAVASIKIPLGETRAEIIIVSAYLPYEDNEVPTEEVIRLVEHCKANELPLLIGCDANAHHTVWGSSNINKRGSELLEYLSTTGLEILNVGSKPTFVTSQRQEVIDLTLGSRKIAQMVTDWGVSKEDTLSDHRQINFSVKGNKDNGTRDTYRNPRSTDWLKYRKELGNRLGKPVRGLRNVPKIEQAAEHLQQAIVQSYEIACPLKVRKSSKRVTWWNAKLNKLRTLSRRLLNKGLKTKADQDWADYKATQKRYKKCIKVSKSEAWKKFCEEIEDLPLVARLRRIFTSGPTTKLGVLTLQDGRVTENDEETLAHLCEVHFPGSELIELEQEEASEDVIKRTVTKQGDWSTAARVVTPDRIRWAIGNFERFKSPGVNKIFPALLQEGK
ncbi:uncharacterized protein LOC123258995 [Cotesia glomerata]|uniref:uncharacterized protein LOC123258995 n=1 Tax=Cotesia glomerata TaxID=32391 RepID=UPI001D029FDF|nr:uncharacterized protein LOC123258995 [Cotesia glomerata]